MPPRQGTGHPSLTPYQAFECSYGPLMICPGNDRLWRKFAEVLGHPEWPDEPRFKTNVQRAEQRVAALPAGALSNTKINRDAYLRLLNGMVFGENPRQGYFRGTRFLHPDLRFELTFPTGWKTANLPDAVVAGSPDNGAQIQLVPGQGTPAQALQGFLGQQGIVVGQSGQTTINGIPAVIASYTAQTESGAVTGIAASSL